MTQPTHDPGQAPAAASLAADGFTPMADEMVRRNRAFANSFADGHIEVAPCHKLAIVAWMDSRMDIFEILGLDHGDAHIIGNAGGVIAEDVIRSLCLS